MKVKKLNENATIPTRNHFDDAGLDLYSPFDIDLVPGEGETIELGIAIALPPNTVGLIVDRSSMGKRGIKVMGGVVDSGYRGELKVTLWNNADESYWIRKGDKIAQLLILDIRKPVLREVKELDGTERGFKGYGSSGR